MGCLHERKGKSYLVEVIGSDGKNFFWGVVDNHVIEDEIYHDEIGLQGFYFSLF